MRFDIQCDCLVTTILSLSCRKRILATGGSSLLKMQLPDSTVVNEPSSTENSCFTTDALGILSSRHSAPLDCKKPPQTRRSSSVFVDYDSDPSESMIGMTSMSNKKSLTTKVDYEHCDSPSTHTAKNSLSNFSRAMSTDADGSDLFFSPKRKDTVPENLFSRTSATEDFEQDDFYIDDFDIDDLNDSDIPNYYEEPASSSVTPQTCSTVSKAIKEGGPTKSQWEKKPSTPPSAPKPSKICSPGEHSGKFGSV